MLSTSVPVNGAVEAADVSVVSAIRQVVVSPDVHGEALAGRHRAVEVPPSSSRYDVVLVTVADRQY